MAYNKHSKYLRSNGEKEEKKDTESTENDSKKKQEYRSSVMTPKRARELAEAEAAAAENADAEGGSAPVAEEKKPEAKQEESASTSRTARQTYRSSVITPKKAAEQTRLAEEAAAHEADAPEPSVTEEAETYETAKRHGTDADIFKGEAGAEKEMSYTVESTQITAKNWQNRAMIRMVASIVFLTAVAAVLQFLVIGIPFTRGLFTTEFSAVPELIAAIAYGPLVGVVICFIKSVIHILVSPASAGSVLTGFILNSLFLTLASLLYGRLLYFRNKKRIEKNKQITFYYSGIKLLLCTLVSAVVSLAPQFFLTKFVAYPLLFRFQSNYFSEAKMLEAYQNAGEGIGRYLAAHTGFSFPTIGSMTDGILYINLPITFGKLAASSLVAAILLRFTLRFFNSANDKEKQTEELSS